MLSLGPLYKFTARAIVIIHSGLAHALGHSGWSWALSIMLLVMAYRLVLVPLFIKQVKAQRTMQMLQPKMKELREKHKGDKPKLNEELLKLQREHGNPLLGCLPILVQIPLFLSLFRVINGFAPHKPYAQYSPLHFNGLTTAQASEIAHAKIFGVSLATSFKSPAAALHLLGGNATATKILAVVLILIMAGTTYLTQRQIVGRNGPVDPSQATQQKLLLYFAPLSLAVTGFFFAIGVLLYWFTTNLWSLGQQFLILRRMPPLAAPGRDAARSPEASGPVRQTRQSNGAPAPAARAIAPQPATAAPVAGAQSIAGRTPINTGNRRSVGSNHPAKRRGKGQRRGGRR